MLKCTRLLSAPKKNQPVNKCLYQARFVLLKLKRLQGRKKSHVVSSFMKKENRKNTSTDSFLNVIGLHVDVSLNQGLNDTLTACTVV